MLLFCLPVLMSHDAIRVLFGVVVDGPEWDRASFTGREGVLPSPLAKTKSRGSCTCGIIENREQSQDPYGF